MILASRFVYMQPAHRDVRIEGREGILPLSSLSYHPTVCRRLRIDNL